VNKLLLLSCVLSLNACGRAEREVASGAASSPPPAAAASALVREAETGAPAPAAPAPAVRPARHTGNEPAIVNVVDVSTIKTPLKLSALETLVLGIGACPLEGYQIVDTCPGMEAFAAGMKGKTASLDAHAGARLLRHTSPAIRVKAAELMADTIESRDAIAAAMAVERDPSVLQAFIRAVADDGARVPKVGEALLAMAGHADRAVRVQALSAIALPANRAMAGGPEKLVAMAERDADPEVRRLACEKGGKLGSEVFLPLYEKATASAADPNMYAACMEGLVGMFHNHPTFDTSSEAAYRLFLRRLEAQPRTDHSPPWNVMSTFCYFSHESDLDKLAAWKRQATYFKPDEVKRVMASVIRDRAASWMARAAAVESMVGLGASRTELADLKKGLDAADRRDRPVVEKLTSVLGEPTASR
jgi:hypothetical protein